MVSELAVCFDCFHGNLLEFVFMFTVHSNKTVTLPSRNLQIKGVFPEVDVCRRDTANSYVAFTVITTLKPELAVIIGSPKMAFNS